MAKNVVLFLERIVGCVGHAILALQLGGSKVDDPVNEDILHDVGMFQNGSEDVLLLLNQLQAPKVDEHASKVSDPENKDILQGVGSLMFWFEI